MNNKRFIADYEIWYILDHKSEEVEKRMWGVFDNQTEIWVTEPEEIDGSYNLARSDAKRRNEELKKKGAIK